MRATLGVAFAVCLLLPAAGRGQAEDQAARAVVDQALKAAGGADKAAKLQAVTWKAKGTLDVGQPIELSGTSSVQGADKLRGDLAAQVQGMTRQALLVFNGDQGWVQANNETRELPKEVRDIITTDFRAIRLVQTLPALRGKDYQLSHLGELKIDNRDAVGVRVAQKDRPDVSLYFDKESSLPVKIEVRVAEMPGTEVTHEFLLSDPK